MNTGSSTSNYNFDNFSNNTNSTSSSVNTGTITTSSANRNVYTGNTKPAPSVETMDLSFATDKVAQESKSILDKVGDFFGGLIDGAKETGAKIVSGAKSIITDGLAGLSKLGSNIVSAAATLASNAGSILGNLATWVLETEKKVRATAAVVGTSIVSGVANIGEGLVDGLTWCGGKVVEGGSWIVGKIAGLFSDAAEQSVMKWREEAKTDVKEFISTDWIGKANDWFYQETSLGQAINENSYLKYDSKLAKGITTATEVVGKIAAATAATIFSGGTAAPIVLPLLLGFSYGTGEKAEQLYRENINTTGSQELGIFVSGLGEAANWYAQGKLGEGAINLINIIKNAGMKNTGALAMNSIKTIYKNIKSDGLINTLKGIKNSGNLASLKAADNLADSAGIIGDNLSDWLTGEEKFNATNAFKAIGELGKAWLANMFFDGASDYLGKLGKNGDNIINSTKKVDLEATQPLKFETTQPLPIIDTSEINKDKLEITQPLPVIDKTPVNNDIDLDITEELDMTPVREKLNPELQEALNKINTKSKVNAQEIKNEILASIEGINDPVLKAKKLYNELSKRVNYNVDYMDMAGYDVLPDKAIDIYQTKVSFDSLESSNVICKGWSELYSELLLEAGFNTNRVHIIGGQKVGSHKWVAIDLGNGNCLVADATNAIKGKTDLYNAKMGLPTQGFLIMPIENIGTKAASPIHFYKIFENDTKYLNDMSNYIRRLDENLGYADEFGYQYDQLVKAQELFSDPDLVDELIPEHIESYVAMDILNKNIPTRVDIDGLEAYAYYNNIIRNTLGRNYNGKIYNNLYISTNSLNPEPLNVITIAADNGPMYNVYSKSTGRLVIDSHEQFIEFISSFRRVI